ncbi:hypothetical protein BX600DRAFT_96110 [Xylariales sp. PMI_506]|nr:hypothetical protein BX600DRAFT_96110 [Xylariales sp. PMI_506]
MCHLRLYPVFAALPTTCHTPASGGRGNLHFDIGTRDEIGQARLSSSGGSMIPPDMRTDWLHSNVLLPDMHLEGITTMMMMKRRTTKTAFAGGFGVAQQAWQDQRLVISDVAPQVTFGARWRWRNSLGIWAKWWCGKNGQLDPKPAMCESTDIAISGCLDFPRQASLSLCMCEREREKRARARCTAVHVNAKDAGFASNAATEQWPELFCILVVVSLVIFNYGCACVCSAVSSPLGAHP